MIFEIALSISLPIEGAVLAITVAEGVIARAVPQINIFAITFGKNFTVIAILAIGIPAIVMSWGCPEPCPRLCLWLHSGERVARGRQVAKEV